MMSREQNEQLSRIGPGTLMGKLLRRYWAPFLLAAEIPEPDCPPVKVKLMGERLIAFRDSKGRVGLIDQFCAHRGASLWFGESEDCGIRCHYHGWKYDITGQCTDLPSEPEESGFRKNIKLKSYPCIEKPENRGERRYGSAHHLHRFACLLDGFLRFTGLRSESGPHDFGLRGSFMVGADIPEVHLIILTSKLRRGDEIVAP